MRSILLFSILLLALLAPVELVAQQAPTRISLVPRIGVLTQASAFKQQWNDPPPEYRQVWRYRFQPDLVLGAAAEVETSALPVGLRLEVNHAPSLRLKHEASSFGPPVYGDARADLTTGTVAALIEPDQACYQAICPRLLLGAGVKHYRFDALLLSDDTIYPFAEDQTRATLQLGVGIATRLAGRLSLIAEINDFSNRVVLFNADDPSGRVHDTLATVGVALRLP
ncbi:MAG TPA: hypothetical protein VGR27_05135 [Longimicrobiaceae bacterium]|nr:hypothetical protein [Longimicrobiaceae bacterium]